MLSLVAHLYMVHVIPKPKIISLVILYRLCICIEENAGISENAWKDLPLLQMVLLEHWFNVYCRRVGFNYFVNITHRISRTTNFNLSLPFLVRCLLEFLMKNGSLELERSTLCFKKVSSVGPFYSKRILLKDPYVSGKF